MMMNKKYKCENCRCDCKVLYYDKKNKRWVCKSCKYE